MTRSTMTQRTCTSVILLGALVVTGPLSGDDSSTADVRKAVERSLTILQKGARNYPSHQTCFSCHHQTLPMLAMTAARAAQIPFDPELLREQGKFTRKAFDERKERLAKGEHIGGRAATVSYGLWTLHLADEQPDELAAAMTSYLLSVQQSDGSWKPPSNRPPLEVSPVSCTVLSAIGIIRFAADSQKERAAEAIDRAKAWLTTASLSEQEDLNFALWAEQLLDGSKERRTTLIEKILSARHPDGGWSQNSTMTSDAYSTGQTLYVLLESGQSGEDQAIRDGVSFLLKSQEQDGSWHVVTRSKPIQPWFDNGDPHDKDQFISITATGWASAALSHSLETPPGK